MNIGIERRKIEDQIVQRFNTIDFKMKHAAWVDSDHFEDFIFSFFNLRRYYETSDDTTVGLEPFRVYMDGLRALQDGAENRKLSIDRRETAQRLIYELNYQMEAVMYEVDQNRQNPSSTHNDSSGGVPVSS